MSALDGQYLMDAMTVFPAARSRSVKETVASVAPAGIVTDVLSTV